MISPTVFTNESAPAGQGLLSCGTIGCVFASIKTPFYEILVNTARSICSRRTRSAFSKLEDNPFGGKSRPCILCQNQPPPGEVNPIVCLMTTLGGNSLDDLPSFYRHFFVSMSTNNCRSAVSRRPNDCMAVFHTTPEWESASPQYAIAVRFRPRNSPVEVWRRGPFGPNGEPCRLSEQEMERLLDICDIKLDEWKDKEASLRIKDEQEFHAYRPPKSGCRRAQSGKSHGMCDLVLEKLPEEPLNSDGWTTVSPKKRKGMDPVSFRKGRSPFANKGNIPVPVSACA